MPTAYTAIVEKREVPFKEFAMLCSRAFGACIDMREDPLSKEIPLVFEPSDYHLKQTEEAKIKLAKISAMSDKACDQNAQEEYDNQTARVEASIKKNCALNIRYKKLLADCESWNPPTSEHIGLKEFMIDQIKISLPGNLDDYYHFPTKITGKQWKEKNVESLLKDIKYHEENYRKECEMSAGRTKWLYDLRKSLEGC